MIIYMPVLNILTTYIQKMSDTSQIFHLYSFFNSRFIFLAGWIKGLSADNYKRKKVFEGEEK